MARVLLMTNPRARGVRPATVAAVRDVLRGGGWRTDEHATRSVTEIRTLAAEAVGGGWDVVAVMGGS